MPNYTRVFQDGHDYFFTIVTHKRNPILIKNINLLKQSFKHSKQTFDYEIKAITVLPEHLHMIITPKDVNEYPNIIKSIKQYFSKHIDSKYYAHIAQSESRRKKGYKPIWQKRYYEHTIRDEKDFKIRFDYIHFNPVKHGLVSKVKDWKHTSFHKYVKLEIYDINWGNFDKNIDFE